MTGLGVRWHHLHDISQNQVSPGQEAGTPPGNKCWGVRWEPPFSALLHLCQLQLLLSPPLDSPPPSPLLLEFPQLSCLFFYMFSLNGLDLLSLAFVPLAQTCLGNSGLGSLSPGPSQGPAFSLTCSSVNYKKPQSAGREHQSQPGKSGEASGGEGCWELSRN